MEEFQTKCLNYDKGLGKIEKIDPEVGFKNIKLTNKIQ